MQFYKSPKITRVILAALIGAVFLVQTACGSEEVPVDDKTTLLDNLFVGNASGNGTAELTRCNKGILPDLNGYVIGSEKKAAFCGNISYGDTFDLVNASTNKTVFTGVVLPYVTADDDNEYYYVGDFSAWEEPGRYYLRTEKTGESEEFDILEDLYADMLILMQKSLYYHRCGFETVQSGEEIKPKQCHIEQLSDTEGNVWDVTGGWHTDDYYNKSVTEGAMAVLYLCTAYELQPNVFKDDIGIAESANEIPDILDEVAYEMRFLMKMQEKSGAVLGGVQRADIKDSQTIPSPEQDSSKAQLLPATDEATLLFAAAGAQFSRVYRNFDSAYADECLYSAEFAYRSAGTLISSSQYLAAAQLYKTTGKSGYRETVESALESGINLNSKVNAASFLGDIAYLTIPRNADAKLCAKRMDLLTGNTKDILEATSAGRMYEATSDASISSVCTDLQCVAYVNSIITNREYRRLMEEHFHYIGGKNDKAWDYTSDTGVTDENGHYLVRENAQLLFSLGTYQ